MFEVGQYYNFSVIEDGGHTEWHGWKATHIAMPLVTFAPRGGGKEVTWNVHSASFVKAEVCENQSDELPEIVTIDYSKWGVDG